MPLCRVNGCCCFDNTKDGSIASGVYTATKAVICLIINCVCFAQHSSYISYNTTLPYFITTMVMACILFLISIVLVYAVRTDQRHWFIPWMVWMLIEIIFIDSSHVIMTCWAIITGELLMLIILLFVVLILAMDIYCFICVYSHYKSFRVTMIKIEGPFYNKA